MTDTIRARHVDDLDPLERALTEQQPGSQYPVRWPLAMPVRQFIERPGELMAWTAVRDGRPVGHVSVQRPGDRNHVDAAQRDVIDVWMSAHGCSPAELAVVSTLFTATAVRGSGLGGRLLATAVDWIQGRGLAPCLEVAQGPSPAVAIYQAHGWRVAKEVYPDWLPDGMDPVLAMILPSQGITATS